MKNIFFVLSMSKIYVSLSIIDNMFYFSLVFKLFYEDYGFQVLDLPQIYFKFTNKRIFYLQHLSFSISKIGYQLIFLLKIFKFYMMRYQEFFYSFVPFIFFIDKFILWVFDLLFYVLKEQLIFKTSKVYYLHVCLK